MSPNGFLGVSVADERLQRFNSNEIPSTTLCATGSSIEYATRLAKILARKTGLPVYVGCSISFAGTTPDEEMEGLTRVVGEVMVQFNKKRDQPP